MKRILNYKSNSIFITEDGIEDFFWPISQVEILKFRELISNNLYENIIYLRKKRHKIESDILLSSFHFVIADLMSFFKAECIVNRCRKKNIEIYPNLKERLIPSILKNKLPDKPDYFKEIEYGPNKKSVLREILSIVKNNLLNKTIKKSFINNLANQNIIITDSINELIERHAEKDNKKVYFIDWSYWFKSIEKPIYNQSKDNILTELVIKSLEKSFNSIGITISLLMKKYVITKTSTLFPVMRLHIHRLKQNKNKIPLNLWTGPLSIPWSRMLAIAVNENYGKVCAHDHGMGAGFRIDKLKRIKEFELASEYITYTKGQINGYKILEDKKYLSIYPMPNFDYYPITNNSNTYKVLDHAKKKNKTSKKDIKNILYFSGAPEGEFFIAYQLPSLVHLDWSSRLLAKLKNWGYSITWKPHPSDNYSTSVNFFKSIGIKINKTDDIENIYQDFDLIICDSYMTTPFLTSICSNTPMILIDFNNILINQAEEKLKKRCSIIKGKFDLNNRASIEWQSLRNSIKESLLLSNNEFAKNYVLND